MSLDDCFSIFFFNAWATLFFGGFLSVILRGSSFIIASIITNLIFIAIFFNTSRSRKVSDRTRKANARNLQIVGFLILAGGGFYRNFRLRIVTPSDSS